MRIATNTRASRLSRAAELTLGVGRGIKVIIANELIRGLPRQGDAMHLIAEHVLPQVVEAMGQPRGVFAAPARLERRQEY